MRFTSHQRSTAATPAGGAAQKPAGSAAERAMAAHIEYLIDVLAVIDGYSKKPKKAKKA